MNNGPVDYEHTRTFAMNHSLQSYGGPAGPSGQHPPVCPYLARRSLWADAGRRFMDLPTAHNTPSWQPSTHSVHTRWSPLLQPPSSTIHNNSNSSSNNNINTNNTNSNFDAGPSNAQSSPSALSLSRPQSMDPSPSSATAAAATVTSSPTQEGTQASSPQAYTPATNVSLETSSAPTTTVTSSTLTAAAAALPGSNAEPSDLQGSGNQTSASSRPVYFRLPHPTPRPGPNGGETRETYATAANSPEEWLEVSRAHRDEGGHSTSSSDDESDLETADRRAAQAFGYAHSTRQSQILRGQMSNKRVASRKALASLESVPMESLAENETTCVICYNDFGVASPEGLVETPLRLPKCRHIFGDKCIRKWLEDSHSCPYCRDKLDSELARPSEAAVRRMFAAAAEVRNSPFTQTGHHFRRMFASYINADMREAPSQFSNRLRREQELGEGPSRREGATRGERRAPPEDHTDAQRRQRPRHDALHSSRPTVAPPQPSFIPSSRHTMNSLHQTAARDQQLRFGSWQSSQQPDPIRWPPSYPQLPQPSPFSYQPNRSQQAQTPMPAPLHLPQLHMMGLSYPPSATGPYNNPLPPVTSHESGYSQNQYHPPPSYGPPPPYMQPLHHPPVPLPGHELQPSPWNYYPTWTPDSSAPSSLLSTPAHFQEPAHTNYNYTGVGQPPPNVTQPPDRTGERPPPGPQPPTS